MKRQLEGDGFLKSHGVYLDYTEETMEEDLATSRRVSSLHQSLAQKVERNGEESEPAERAAA